MSELGSSEKNNKKYWPYDQYYNTTDRYEVHIYKIIIISVVFISKKRRDQSKEGQFWFKSKIVEHSYQFHNDNIDW